MGKVKKIFDKGLVLLMSSTLIALGLSSLSSSQTGEQANEVEQHDWATDMGGNPWDMDGPGDIIQVYEAHGTQIPYEFKDGILSYKVATGDTTTGYGHSSFSLNCSEKNIDTTKYHNLSFRIYADRENSNNIRCFSPNGDKNHVDLARLKEGWNEYHFDLTQLKFGPLSPEDKDREGIAQFGGKERLVNWLELHIIGPIGTEVKVDWVKLTGS